MKALLEIDRHKSLDTETIKDISCVLILKRMEE